MDKNNGFKVNTESIDSDNKNKKTKFNKSKKLIIWLISVIALVLLMLLPVFNSSSVSKRIGVYADGQTGEAEYYGKNGLAYKTETYIDGEVCCSTEIKYNSKNEIIEKDISYWGELTNKEIFTYEKGSLKNIERTDSEGSIESNETFYYGEDGILLNSAYFDENGEQLFRYDYTFENGKKTSEKIYDIKGDLTYDVTYSYDKENLVKENFSSGEYYKRNIEYSYNSKGLLATKKSDYEENGFVSYNYEFMKKKVSLFRLIFKR